MAVKIRQQSLTLKDFQEVIIPAMEKIFATKKDLERFLTKDDALRIFLTKDDAVGLFATKKELFEFKDQVLSNQDAMIKDLEVLKTEKTVGNYQTKKRLRLLKMIVNALRKHRILTSKQLATIKQMGIF